VAGKVTVKTYIVTKIMFQSNAVMNLSAKSTVSTEKNEASTVFTIDNKNCFLSSISTY